MAIMFSKISVLGFISTAAAHGIVTGIVADGTFYEGYNPAYQYITPAPITTGWVIPGDLGNGFISPSQFDTPDFICHIGATNAQIAAPIKAGGKVELQWTPWPTSHKGPVIDYLANCNGPCETVDKTTLKFFKIDQLGLLDPSTTDGTWATDTLIANNNSWTVTIPPTIATGNYVLRHEILALHNANNANGAQEYPFCINLAITSSGTDNPVGVLGEDLYTPTDPGVDFDLYGALSTYQIPGPTLYSGAVSLTQTLPPAPTASASGVYTVGGAAPVSVPVSSSTPVVVSTKSSTSSTSTTLKTSVISSTTSKTTSTTPSATATGATVPKYGQCGGQGWTGGTVCAAGSTCTATNIYYSQCV